MDDEKRRFRRNLLLITYGIILFIVLSNFSQVGVFLNRLLSIMAPFLYSIGIAFLLNILMKLFENKLFAFMDKRKRLRRMKRPISLVATFMVVILFFFGFIAFVIPQLIASATQLTNSVPEYLKSLEKLFNDTTLNLGLTNEFWSSVKLNWSDIITKSGQFITATIPVIVDSIMSLTNSLINLVLGIVISIYLLASKEKLILMLKKMTYAFFPKKFSHRIMELGSLTNKAFEGFISGQVTEALIIGVLCFIGMIIFGMPYAILVSVVIAVTSVIPMVGAFIGTIPSAFIILMVDPPKALWFVIFIIILQQFESNIIYPKVVGNSIGLNGLWIIFVVIVGGSFFGLVGMLVGIPAFAVLYRVIKRLTHKKLEEKNIEVEALE